MFDLATYLTFLLACVAVVIVPGPTVTVIIANSLRHGSRAGLANVAGTQLGLAVMLVILATGLQLVIEAMGTLFVYVKLIGAAYLIADEASGDVSVLATPAFEERFDRVRG